MCQRKEVQRMPWGVTRTSVVHSRMVRENLSGSPEKQKQTQNSEAQSEQAGTSSESQDAEGGLLPVESTDIQLELHKWSSESDSPDEHEWRQALSEVDGVALPTHLRSFSSLEQYRLVKQTFQQLQHSGYYWGALTMEEAHAILSEVSLGTFLIRDSVQPDVFFTLSYRGVEAPTSVRVLLNKDLLFSLHGSHKTFSTLFALLTHYTGPGCKLTAPHRKERPERLTHICRRALVLSHGMDSIRTLPGLSAENRNYIYLYPYSI
uniref:Suppressor of cytokine signaling 1b n=1 Tax=Neogobius melanostomus TaxID=47308 RepID=A0A8C6WPA6_9GOBI